MRCFYDFLDFVGVQQPPSTCCQPVFRSTHLDWRPQSQYRLTEESKTRVQHYLSNEPCCQTDFGKLSEVDFVIAFSFGDGAQVNRSLAQVVRHIHATSPSKALFIQQEIAVHISDISVASIDSEQYQTTFDVAKSAVDLALGKRALVIAQSWHASRCIKTCQDLGLQVEALRVVNEFPSNDPQPWVRNPINWVIKESHREVATGYEISELYNLR